ncbi:hypothetical protein ECANGB1_438 [Enterospora canceri]|uniref:Uncharacterized protein n=1 Tax=Enterospora canceri TaxID=1081671 RepID=A0A1Y1S5J3_9MICR|nr:hypothetical protein ECANGB1_438 [Enterospora canceri]
MIKNIINNDNYYYNTYYYNNDNNIYNNINNNFHYYYYYYIGNIRVYQKELLYIPYRLVTAVGLPHLPTSLCLCDHFSCPIGMS